MADAWRPTAHQCLLLNAVLAPEERAMKAWNRWANETVLEDIEQASQLLLPMLYVRLRNWQVDDPILVRYRAVHRYWMLRNTRVRQRLDEIITRLVDRGIGTVVVDGDAALFGCIYNSPAIRPVRRTAVLIAPQDRVRAMDLCADLARADMKPKWRIITDRIASLPRGGMQVPSTDDDKINILWTNEGLRPASQPLSNFTDKIDPARPRVRRLKPEIRMVQTLAQSVRVASRQSLFWIVDTLRSIEHEDVNWMQVVQYSSSMRCADRVANGLHYLCAEWDAAVPAWVHVSLDKLPLSPEDAAYRRGHVPTRDKRVPRMLRRVHAGVISRGTS